MAHLHPTFNVPASLPEIVCGRAINKSIKISFLCLNLASYNFGGLTKGNIFGLVSVNQLLFPIFSTSSYVKCTSNDQFAAKETCENAPIDGR